MDKERMRVTVDGLKTAYSQVGMAGFSKDTHPLDLVLSAVFDVKGGLSLLVTSISITESDPVGVIGGIAMFTTSRIIRGLFVGRFGFNRDKYKIN